MIIFLVEKNSRSFFVVFKEQFMIQANPFKCLTYSFLKLLDYSDCSWTSENWDYLKGFLLRKFQQQKPQETGLHPFGALAFCSLHKPSCYFFGGEGRKSHLPSSFNIMSTFTKWLCLPFILFFNKCATHPGGIWNVGRNAVNAAAKVRAGVWWASAAGINFCRIVWKPEFFANLGYSVFHLAVVKGEA